MGATFAGPAAMFHTTTTLDLASCSVDCNKYRLEGDLHDLVLAAQLIFLEKGFVVLKNYLDESLRRLLLLDSAAIVEEIMSLPIEEQPMRQPYDGKRFCMALGTNLATKPSYTHLMGDRRLHAINTSLLGDRFGRWYCDQAGGDFVLPNASMQTIHSDGPTGNPLTTDFQDSNHLTII